MSDRPYRILIVEDSPEDRAAYRRRIAQGREQDYQFWETGSGEEGLRLCARDRARLHLARLSAPRPGRPGIPRPRAGRWPTAPTISVIMLTGHGNEAVAVQAMKKGVQDYLVKGINNEALRQVVQSAIDKGVLRKQVAEQRREVERLSVERLQLVEGVATTNSRSRRSKPAQG